MKIFGPAVCLLLWLGALMHGAIVAVEAAVEPVQRYAASATVRFAGTSTLHDFEGRLPARPFTLVLSNGTWFADADVLSGQMATGSEKRDRNMHRMLGTNEHPRIHGAVAGAPIPGSAGTNVTLRLQIRDRTKELPARISAWKETVQEIRFHANWDLSLKEFGLKPPSVAGAIRVGDRVRLEADVTVSKAASSSAPITASP